MPPQLVDHAVGDDGRPKAATSGQYDGDGMWMCWPGAAASVPTAPVTAASSGTSTSRPSSSSVYLRCQKSSMACDRRDLGEVVLRRRATGSIHSSVRASHGSSPTSVALRRDVEARCTMNTSTPTAMMNAPMVDDHVPEVPAHARRRRCRCAGACPAGPRMCIGTKVRLKPMKHQPEVPSCPASRRASCRRPSGTSSRCRRRGRRSSPPNST